MNWNYICFKLFKFFDFCILKDVDDLSQDCSLLTERLPDVISQQQMNHVDCLRMRNSLTEILEEVKLRRVGTCI